MAMYGFPGTKASPRMPIAGGTVNGVPFSVPRGARAMTIHVPALTGTGATVKIQTLNPDSYETTETWADISVFDLTDGTFEVLDGLVESTSVTLPVTATGGGVLRFVASEDQSSAAVNVPVFFHF